MSILRNFAVAGLVWASGLSTAAAEEKWPLSKPEPVPGIGTGFPRLVLNNENGHSREFARRARYNLDRRCLSRTNLSAKFKVDVIDYGMPVVRCVEAPEATPSDIFYFEQAIWEMLPPPWTKPEFVVKNIDIRATVQFDAAKANEARGLYPELIPDRKNQVKLHFVPISIVTTRPGAFLDFLDIQAPANVVRMELTASNQARLQVFRQEWCSFLRTNPILSREQLMAMVQQMKVRYGALFSQ